MLIELIYQCDATTVILINDGLTAS